MCSIYTLKGKGTYFIMLHALLHKAHREVHTKTRQMPFALFLCGPQSREELSCISVVWTSRRALRNNACKQICLFNVKFVQIVSLVLLLCGAFHFCLRTAK